MATEADIPAPICETRRNLGDATNISNITLPQEEKTQADTSNGLSTVESENFLKTPSIGEVHCEVNYTSRDASEGTKKPDQTVNNDTAILLLRTPKLDYQPEDPGKQLETTGNGSHEDVEKQSKKTLEDIITNDTDPKFSEKTAESLLIRADGSHMEHDEELKKESEKLPVTEISTGKTNDNESAVIDKVKDEDEDLCRAELSENEKNTSTLLKEDLHVVPENSKASDLGQDNETRSSSEEQSTNVNLHGITSEVTEDKQIDAVDTQKEVLESFSTIVSSNPEEGSTNAVLQGITSEKTIDEVDIQNEVLEESSTIGSNEETKEKSMIETKIEELLEKESDKTSSPQAELCEVETSTESMLPEIEPKIEKPEESLNVASEDIKTSDLSHEIETSSVEEQTATAHSQDEKTDDKALDAADIKEEIFQNVQTIVSNEKTEENSLIQDGDPQKKYENLEKDSEKPSLTKYLGQEIETSSFEEQSAIAHSQIILDQKTEDKARDAAESKEENLGTEENLLIQVGGHLEKDSEKPSLIKDFIGNANDDELTVTDEVKSEHVNRVELFEKERNIESDLLKEEVHVKKPVQAFPSDLEDNKASDLGQHTETTSFREVQGLTENPQGTLSEKTEETTDAADTKKRTQERQNVAIIVSNEDNDKNSSIQLDASQMKHDTYLKKEIGKPQLIEASTEDINDESTIMHDAEIGNESIRKVGLSESDKNIDSTLLKKENLQEAPEDHKLSASSEDRETTCSIDEQSLTANPQSIMSDKTSDATDTKEVNLQHVATKTPHEHTEENLPVQVDCSQTEHEEHLGKESENLSLTEASLEEQQYVSLEKHTDSVQAASDDIKASDSTHDTKMSAIEEEILAVDPREISNDKKEETTDDAAVMKTPELQDIATNILDRDNANNSLIEEDGSENQSLKEVSLEKADDNVSAVTHEAKFVEEHLIKADLLEKEKHEGTLVKEEVPIESLQVADEDIKASALVQDREKSSLEEQSLATKSQGIMGDGVKTNDATNMEKESQEDKNAATTSYEVSEETSQIQGDVSQLKQSELLEKESESTPLTEARARDTAENILAKEEADMEKTTDNVQVTTEDIKASASGQDTETSSIKEQIPIADPQEISSDKIEEKTIVAAYTKEKTLEDVATKVPNWDNEDNLPIEMDDSQKPSLKEAAMGNTNDDESINIHEAKFVDENLTKANLIENEKSIECTSVEKEVLIESLQEADEDIKACASCHDREITSLVEQDPIMGDKEDKTTEATNLKEETPEEKDIAIKVQSGENEDNSPTKVDSSQKPSLTEALTGNATEVQEIATYVASGDNEDNSPTKVDGSQDPSLTEASKGNTTHHESKIMHEPRLVDESFLKADLAENEKNTDGTLVKEEKYIESLKVTIEDIKASASGQDRETSSQEEQSLIANPQKNVGSDREDKPIDATDLEEEISKEMASKPVAVEIPSMKDSDVNTDTVVDIAEDPNCKQEESSITTASEEHMMICNEHVANVTSSASEPSEQDIDKTNTEKMTVLDDGSTKIPTNENLVTDPTESIKADAQVPDEENKAELKQQDTETGASQDVSDSPNSVALENVSSSNVASEKDLTSKPSLESRKETRLEAENEEAQKQDGDLHVSAVVQDSSMEQIENDVQSCPASAIDSEMQEMQKLEEAPLPDPNENTIENTDCKESEVVEDATKSFLNDEKLTEREQDETECKQDKVLLDETVGEIKEPASIPVANDFLPKKFIETLEIDHSTAERQLTLNREDPMTGKRPTGDHEESKLDKEKEEAGKQKISDFSSAALNIIEAGDKDGANRSIADVEAKIDDKAPEIIQTAPSATKSQEVESISVGETSGSISQCERDDYEHAHIGTEEIPDSNEVGFSPEESKCGYEAKSQVLESIDQIQCCAMISKAGENLEAAAEIKSETVIVEDIFEPKETMKVNIYSEKIKEDEDVQNDRLGSFKEKAVTESHLDQVKQEEKTNTEEIFEVIKNSSETEKVSKVPDEADDKDVEKPEEKIQANESKEQDKSIDDVTQISDTGEVNSSTVAFLEDGDKSTISDDVDNEIAKDEGFLNQNSNTSVEDAASGTQPKRPDENIMCEAPPTKTVHTTIDDTEDKKENANTIMMQHQADDSKRKHESTPLPEFTQGIESEKQAEKDETCSSDEVQTKDEVLMMLSDGKGDEEAKKEDTSRKQTDDEDKNTYVEAEKVDFSTHTEDTTEVSQHEAAQDVPPDNENSTTKNENLETKVSSEGQEAESNRKAPVSETLEQEIEEQQLKRTSEAVTEAREVNRQEEKIIDDDCSDLIENSSCAASEKISESNVHQSSTKDTSTTQSDKKQESERQIDSLPILPVAKCSDIEIAEKDLPMQFSGLDSTGGTEIKVTPIPSNDKHIVLEADHTKNINPENTIGNKNISVIEHGDSAKCSQGEHELLKTHVLEPEEATCEHEEKTSPETTRSTEKSESKEIDKSSLSDLFSVSMKETSQTAYHSASEKEPATHSKHLQAEKSDEAEHEEMKTDEEKNDEDESSEQRQLELCSEAPVMVDTRDADVKVAHKKSHNILSGVGSKVKHSIAKVKKAITGKSSQPKPPSPK